MTQQKPVPATAGSQKRARFFLILTSILLAIWIALMLVMYFTTVYPQRHPATRTPATMRLS